MKSFCLLLFITLCLNSCIKKEKGALVIRDCSGTYLQIEGLDYKVCNKERIANLSDSSRVNVKFRKKSSCANSASEKACLTEHPNEGWIKITQIF